MSQPPRRMKANPTAGIKRVKANPIKKREKVTRVRFRFHKREEAKDAEEQDRPHEEQGVGGHRDGVVPLLC